MKNQEIERKFLVKGNFKNKATTSFTIIQGFLSTIPERTVRVRIKEEEAFLTIKGIGNDSGTTRFEWEKKINLEDAKDLLSICEPNIIKKMRYIIPVSRKLFFEIDVFQGKNKGLLIAEIELADEAIEFEKPSWLGEEVTGDEKYYNSYLVNNPFSEWK